MSADAGLEAFAYGEHLEQGQGRSLGFRLLIPEVSQSWSAEVETLARRLQSAPFPDHWTTTDLFCSVLLADGQRLVALARYGLEDHTPGKRRGGLELMGVVGPKTLSVTATLAIYQWLRGRCAAMDAVSHFTGKFDLVEVLAELAAPPPIGDLVPVLPIRMWQEGAPAFRSHDGSRSRSSLGAAGTQHQSSLAMAAVYRRVDFPLATYTQRGPIVAWTPHLTGVALKFDHPPALSASPHLKSQSFSWLMGFVVLLFFGLLAANAWYLWRLEHRLSVAQTAPATHPLAGQDRPEAKRSDPSDPKLGDKDQLARALYQYLRMHGGFQDSRKDHYLRTYERLVAIDESLQVAGIEGKLAIGALSSLTRRKTPAQVHALILDAGEKKGIDEKILEIIAERVSQRMVESE